MYVVKCIALNGAQAVRSGNIYDENYKWKYNEVGKVSDDVIAFYLNHSDSFSVLGKDGALSSSDGLEVVTGLSASDSVDGILHQTTFVLSAVALSITDALAYASKKLFTFPAGRIELIGVTSSLAFAVTTTRASTINASASMTYGLGSAAASNATLATTMVDMTPKTTQLLDGAVAAYTIAKGAALAASAQFDGTSTPVPMYFNAAFETGTDIDADGAIAISGSIAATWANLGDY